MTFQLQKRIPEGSRSNFEVQWSLQKKDSNEHVLRMRTGNCIGCNRNDVIVNFNYFGLNLCKECTIHVFDESMMTPENKIEYLEKRFKEYEKIIALKATNKQVEKQRHKNQKRGNRDTIQMAKVELEYLKTEIESLRSTMQM